MKTLTIALLCWSFTLSAQKSNDQIIADSSFGWMKVYHFKGVTTPRKLDDRNFSAAQLSICDSFANWVQASYIPKGTIGDVRKVIMPKIGLYNAYQKFGPQGFGATAYTWTLEMKNGKPTPIQETEIPWGITANEIPGRAMENLCTNGDYYFFMEETDPFENNVSKKIIDQYNIKTLPQFSGFNTTHSTASRYDRNAGFVEAVLLCKNNQLPFIKVTVGDMLNKVEKLIYDEHDKKLKDIKEKNGGNQKNIDYFTSYENGNYQKALTTFAKHKERYKNKFNDQAFIPALFDYIDFTNDMDIFTRSNFTEGGSSTLKTFPVYKFAPGIVEQSKQDKPLWIRVTWNWQLGDERTRHMHESIINNFNFQYLYNFFFDAEKVKGKPYQPLHSPYEKEPVLVVEKSKAAKEAANNTNVYFFEDFSSNADGQKPTNWYSEINQQGSYTKVITLPGQEGKWLEVKGHNGLIPNHLKKPLPQNFTLSFDVAVPQNFTWGAKGLYFQLSKETSPGNAESYLNLRLRPGFAGKDGEAVIDAKFPSPPGYLNGTKWMAAPGFSNNKKFNRITVTIKKAEEKLLIFIDKTKMAEYEKAIPSALLFNALSFTHANSDGETEKYFISNIKIIKD